MHAEVFSTVRRRSSYAVIGCQVEAEIIGPSALSSNMESVANLNSKANGTVTAGLHSPTIFRTTSGKISALLLHHVNAF